MRKLLLALILCLCSVPTNKAGDCFTLLISDVDPDHGSCVRHTTYVCCGNSNCTVTVTYECF